MLIPWGYPGDSLQNLLGFLVDSWEINQWQIFRGILRDSQEKSWEIDREIRVKFKGYCSISHFSLFYIDNNKNLKFFW